MSEWQNVNIKVNDAQLFPRVYEHKPIQLSLEDSLFSLYSSLIKLTMLWTRHSHDLVVFWSQLCFAL